MFYPWYHHNFMAPHRFNIFNAPPPAPAAVGARGPASCAPPSPAPSPLRSTGKQWKKGGRCVWHIWKMLPKTGKCCGRSWKMEKGWGPVSKMSKHAEGPTLGVSFAVSSHFKKNKHQRPRVLVQYGGITHFHEKKNGDSLMECPMFRKKLEICVWNPNFWHLFLHFFRFLMEVPWMCVENHQPQLRVAPPGATKYS